MQISNILPTQKEIRLATPGLLKFVIPIVLASEAIYWLESEYVQTVYHVPAPVISLMIAAVISIIVTNVIQVQERYVHGLQFTTKWLLKIGIVIYGLNFSYSLWLRPGSQWILVIGLLTVAVPMIVGFYVGRGLQLDQQSSVLVAVGTGVCGISAIIATQQALKSDEESAGMALATILVFGTFVLFLYPVLAGILALNQTVYGFWTGATTLDLPQLVAAALQGGGNTSLLSALWVKSIRIGLLAPLILILTAIFHKQGRNTVDKDSSRFRNSLQSFPLFILAFFLIILLNTLFSIPASILAPIATGKGEPLSLNAASILLTTAIIGICFRVKRNVIGKTGWKIMITGGIAWIVQSLLIFWLANVLPIPQA